MGSLLNFTTLGVQGYQPIPGQYPGTPTSDSSFVGNVGEIQEAYNGAPTLEATCTISIASPGIVTAAVNTSGTITANMGVYFTTTGTLPTGLSPNTTYYVVNPSSTQFALSATAGGASINTSGSQSGTHTLHPYAYATGNDTIVDIGAISLPPGDWKIHGQVYATTITGAAQMTDVEVWTRGVSASYPALPLKTSGFRGGSQANYIFLGCLPYDVTVVPAGSNALLYISGRGSASSGDIKLGAYLKAERRR